MTPEYASQLHPGIGTWLDQLRDTGRAHGSQLVVSLTRMSDNCAMSDRILRIFIEHEWVIQDMEPSPSTEQLFFGWGGRRPGKRPNRHTAGASEFGYYAGVRLPESSP